MSKTHTSFHHIRMILALLMITVLAGGALAQTNPTVTVQFSGSGSGTVTDDKSVINATYDGTSASGTTAYTGSTAAYTITLNANPAEGHKFVKWIYNSGLSTSTNSSLTLSVTADQSILAEFEPVRSLLVQGSGTGAGRIISDEIAGINALYDGSTTTGSVSSGDLEVDTNVTITATPEAGSAFTGWTGASSSTDATITITVDKAKNLTANFTTADSNNIISGIVTLSDSPLAGATLTLDGTVGGGGRGGTTVNETATSAADGSFSFTVQDNFSGSLTASYSSLSPTPLSYTYTDITNHQPGQDFSFTSTTFYSISGTVVDDSANPMVDVDVILEAGSNYPTRTDENGNYTLSVPENTSGTLTASYGGYAFSPTSYIIPPITSNLIGVDFTGTVTYYTVDGYVRGTDSYFFGFYDLAGATITGDVVTSPTQTSTVTATSDANGNWSFDVPAGSAVTITPSKAEYVFVNPPTISLSEVNSNTTVGTLTGEHHDVVLSGTILDDSNNPVSGVQVQLDTGDDDFIDATTITDSNGDYQFRVFANSSQSWLGRVEVNDTYPLFEFDPAAGHLVGPVNTDQTGLDFTRNSYVPPTYTISGTVTDQDSAPLAGVTIQIYPNGEAEFTNTATTAGDGTYSVSVEEGWSGRLVPVKTGYDVFSPTERTLSNITADTPNQDFQGTINTYALGGTITNQDGYPLENVQVDLSGDSTDTTTTAADGSYSFTVEHGFSGTITPSGTDFTSFSPGNRALTNVIADDSSLDFQGNLKTYTISGTVLDTDGQTVILASLELAGTQIVGNAPNESEYQFTNSNGEFSFEVYIGFNGTLTPGRTGSTFTPTERTYTDVQQDFAEQDFEADIELYLVSGQILNATSPMSGVQVNATITSVGTAGLDAADYNSQTTYTDSNGIYSFLVRKNDSIEISPVKENWLFTPGTQQVLYISSDTTGLDFAAELPYFNISGIVTRAGKPLKDISVELGEYSATTDGSGLYEITVPNGTRGTLSPTTPGYSYSPGSREIEINLGNAPYQDFSAIPAVAGAPQIHYFVATPDGFAANGKGKLTWQVSDAVSVSIEGIGQNLNNQGRRPVEVDKTTTFILTATNPRGTSTAQAIMTVAGPPVILHFAADHGDDEPLNAGEKVTLAYLVKGASKVTVSKDDGRSSGTRRLNAVAGSTSYRPNRTTVYTLRAENGLGSVERSQTVPVTRKPAILGFSADPEIILQGEETTLDWQTRRAATVAIDSGIGPVNNSGNLTDAPLVSTVYTLAATNSQGTSNAEAEVTVVPPHLAVDLSVSFAGSTAPASTPTVGEFQRMTVQLTNQGPAMARDFWISSYNGDELVDMFYVKQIKPGGTRSFMRNLPLLFAGANEFTATVDSGANLDLDTENNSAEKTITAIATAGSDLMVVSAFIYATDVADVYYFETRIWNVGSGASEAGQLDIKVSEKKKYGGEVVRVLDAELQGLKPRKAKLVTGYFTWTRESGYMQLKIDEHLVHPGSNNANDHLQVPFDVSRLPAR